MTAQIGQDQAATFFLAEAPPGLTGDLLRVVLAAYPMAFAQAEQYPFEEAHDLRPHIRRAAIEASMSALSVEHAVIVTSTRNSTGNAFHKEVFFGRVILTHSMIPTPESRIPDARFRQSLARNCNLPMFREFAEPPSADDALLWAVLVHGPAEDQRVPAFVRLAFPLADGSHTFDLNLVGLGGAVAVVAPPDVTAVPEPQPVLRPDVTDLPDEEEGS